jgi:hypothetical protein
LLPPQRHATNGSTAKTISNKRGQEVGRTLQRVGAATIMDTMFIDSPHAKGQKHRFLGYYGCFTRE